MQKSLWATVGMWTRIIFLIAVLVHLLILFIQNGMQSVDVHLVYVTLKEANLLLVLLSVSALSILFYVLIGSIISITRRLRATRPEPEPEPEPKPRKLR